MKTIFYYLLILAPVGCIQQNYVNENKMDIREIYETDSLGEKHGLYLKMKGDEIIEKISYNHGVYHGKYEVRMGDSIIKKTYDSGNLTHEKVFLDHHLLVEKEYFDNERLEYIKTYFPEQDNSYIINSSIYYNEDGVIQIDESNFIYHYKNADTIIIRAPHENSISASVESVKSIKDRYNYELVKKMDVELLSNDEYRFVIEDISEKDSTIFFRVEIKRKAGNNIYLNDVNFFKVENSKLLDSVNVMPLW